MQNYLFVYLLTFRFHANFFAFAAAAAMLPLIVRFFILSVVVAAVVKLFRLQCPLLAFFSSRNFHSVRCICVCVCFC